MRYIFIINERTYTINTDICNIVLIILWIISLIISAIIFTNTHTNVALIDGKCYYSDNNFVQASYPIDGVILCLNNVTLVSNESNIYENNDISMYKESILLSATFPPVLGPISYMYYPDSTCIDQKKKYKFISIWLICLFDMFLFEYILILILCIARCVYLRRNNDSYIGIGML